MIKVHESRVADKAVNVVKTDFHQANMQDKNELSDRVNGEPKSEAGVPETPTNKTQTRRRKRSQPAQKASNRGDIVPGGGERGKIYRFPLGGFSPKVSAAVQKYCYVQDDPSLSFDRTPKVFQLMTPSTSPDVMPSTNAPSDSPDPPFTSLASAGTTAGLIRYINSDECRFTDEAKIMAFKTIFQNGVRRVDDDDKGENVGVLEEFFMASLENVKKLGNKVAALRNEVDALKSEVATLKNEALHRNKDIAGLRDELVEKDKEVAEREKQVERLRVLNTFSLAAAKAGQNKKHALELKVKEGETTENSVYEQQQRIQAENERDLEMRRHERTKFELLNARKEAILSGLEAGSLKLETEALRLVTQSADADRDALRRVQQEHSLEIDRLKSRNGEVEEELSTVGVELSTVKEELSVVKGENVSQGALMKTMEVKLKAAVKRKDSVEDDLISVKDEMARVSADNEDLRKTVSGLNNKFASAISEMGIAKDRLSEVLVILEPIWVRAMVDDSLIDLGEVIDIIRTFDPVWKKQRDLQKFISWTPKDTKKDADFSHLRMNQYAKLIAMAVVVFERKRSDPTRSARLQGYADLLRAGDDKIVVVFEVMCSDTMKHRRVRNDSAHTVNTVIKFPEVVKLICRVCNVADEIKDDMTEEGVLVDIAHGYECYSLPETRETRREKAAKDAEEYRLLKAADKNAAEERSATMKTFLAYYRANYTEIPELAE